MTKSLSFHGVQLDVVERNGIPWLNGPQIAEALGMAKRCQVADIYARHKDEFSAEMTFTLKMRVSKNLITTVRVFSPRGCHLIGMLARTERAKEFRKWVLDVLDCGASVPVVRQPANSVALDYVVKAKKALLTGVGTAQTPLEREQAFKAYAATSEAVDTILANR